MDIKQVRPEIKMKILGVFELLVNVFLMCDFCCSFYSTVVKIQIRNLTGEVSSPGYPQNMEQANYHWVFRSPNPNTLVAFSFEDVQLQRQNDG